MKKKGKRKCLFSSIEDEKKFFLHIGCLYHQVVRISVYDDEMIWGKGRDENRNHNNVFEQRKGKKMTKKRFKIK